MKLLPLILVIILCSCSQDDWVEYRLLIENSEEFSPIEKVENNNLLLNKLHKYGFREAEINFENDTLIVRALLNTKSKNEISYLKSMFKSNRIEFFNTYRVSDQKLDKIDTSMLKAEHFIPYYQLVPGFYVEEVLGICKDQTKLNDIINTISHNFSHIENMKLHWSIGIKDETTGKEGNFKLYMINSDRQSNNYITEQDMKSVRAIEDRSQTGIYLVNFNFTYIGAKKWAKMTEDATNNGNRSIAIILNGIVQTVPRVMSPIYSGQTSLSGNFSKEEAENLARSIRIGRLDYKLNLLSEKALK